MARDGVETDTTSGKTLTRSGSEHFKRSESFCGKTEFSRIVLLF